MGPSGFMVECIFVFDSHNTGNFHQIEKNKISKTELGSLLSKPKSVSEIEQTDFVLPGESTKCVCLVRHKIEIRCPILEIQLFPERKCPHLNFAP